jgi:hypothetical protein
MRLTGSSRVCSGSWRYKGWYSAESVERRETCGRAKRRGQETRAESEATERASPSSIPASTLLLDVQPRMMEFVVARIAAVSDA